MIGRCQLSFHLQTNLQIAVLITSTVVMKHCYNTFAEVQKTLIIKNINKYFKISKTNLGFKKNFKFTSFVPSY